MAIPFGSRKTGAMSRNSQALLNSAVRLIVGATALSAFSFFAFQCASIAASGDVHFERAMRYEFAGDMDGAIAEYRRGLQQSPESVDGHTRLGTLLLDNQGDIDGAISEFVTALTIDPQCHFCQSRLDEAVSRRNDTVRDGINRGNDFYRAGQLNRSAAAYRIAIAADPNDAEARNCLAWTLYRMGKLEDSLAEVKEALRIKPNEPEYINTLACVQFDLGNVDAAITNFKKAISGAKTPNPADYYGLSVAYLAKGDETSSIKWFKEAVKSDQQYVNAIYLRDKIGLSVHTLALHDKLIGIAGNLEDLAKEGPASAPNESSSPSGKEKSSAVKEKARSSKEKSGSAKDKSEKDKSGSAKATGSKKSRAGK